MDDSLHMCLVVGLALGVWLVLNAADEVAAGAPGPDMMGMGNSGSFVQMRRKALANGLGHTPPMG